MKLTNLSMAKGCILAIIFLGHINVNAQAGIYEEADIEYQTLFIEAQHAKFKGDTDKEIELLGKIIKRDKAAHAAYYELAKTYLLLNDHELAQKNAEKAHKLEPKNEYYLLTLAEVMDLSGQTGKAIGAYQNLKIINPSNPTIYHKLAQLQLQDGDAAGAVATLEALQNNQGTSEETSRRIFNIHKKTGNKKAAVASLRTLINANPDNTRYLNNLASYYLETDDQKGAEKVYKEIIAIDPNDSKASLALLKKDAVQAAQDDKSGYVTALSPMIENMNLPLDDKIKELMPIVSTMKKGDASVQALSTISERLVSLYPKEAKVYSLQGDVYFYQGDLVKSEQSYKKAISIDDRKYTLWSQYMQNLWELKKMSELRDISEEAIDLYPNKVSAFLFHAISQSDKDEAIYMTDEAGMIAGQSPALQNQVAVVKAWLDKKTVNKATVSAIDLKQLADPIFFELAGDLYAAIKDSSMAKKLYDKAVDLGASQERLNAKSGS